MAARDELDIPMPAMAPSYRAAPRRRPDMDPATRRLAVFAGTIGGALLLLVTVWSLTGHHRAGVPVIEADSRPLRSKPLNPGGLQVAGGDDAIMSGQADGQSSIAPGPEAPAVQALHAQERLQQQAAEKAGEAIGQPALPSAPTISPERPLPPLHPHAAAKVTSVAGNRAATPASQMTAQLTAAPEPAVAAPQRRLQLAQSTAPISAEPLPPPAGTPAARPAPAAEGPVTTPLSSPPTDTMTMAPSALAPSALAPSALAPSSPAPSVLAPTTALAPAGLAPSPRVAPHAMPAAASAAVAAPHVAGAGHAVVQLGALTSGEAAALEWTRLQRKYPELFASHAPNVTKTERNGQTFWRLRTDGFADTAAAAVFCQRVKAKGATCAVATF